MGPTLEVLSDEQLGAAGLRWACRQRPCVVWRQESVLEVQCDALQRCEPSGHMLQAGLGITVTRCKK